MKEKERKANRVATALCVAMLVSIIGAHTGWHVQAANNTDTLFGYFFTTSVQYIPGREKSDYTSVYMHYQNGTPSYTAKVCWQVGGNAPMPSNEDATSGTPFYQFTSLHQKRFMYNMVYENHHAYAAAQHQVLYAGVKGTCSTYNGVVQGYWSPDSIYQSGVLPGTDHL